MQTGLMWKRTAFFPSLIAVNDGNALLAILATSWVVDRNLSLLLEIFHKFATHKKCETQ